MSGFYYVYLKYLEMFDIAGSSTLYGIKERGNEDSIEVLAPVPSYEQWQAKLEENTKLKEQVNHLSKTQSRQFVDNQKLQIKAKHAKDVVNIDTARQIKKLKELLKDLISESDDALQSIQKDCESDDFSIYNYPEVQNYELLKNKIKQALGEE